NGKLTRISTTKLNNQASQNLNQNPKHNPSLNLNLHPSPILNNLVLNQPSNIPYPQLELKAESGMVDNRQELIMAIDWNLVYLKRLNGVQDQEQERSGAAAMPQSCFNASKMELYGSALHRLFAERKSTVCDGEHRYESQDEEQEQRQQEALTFSHSEEISEVPHRSVNERWLGALDVAKGEEGFVVCGQISETEKVVTLLGSHQSQGQTAGMESADTDLGSTPANQERSELRYAVPGIVGGQK
ncbi:hypothetical protein DNTS_024894, partial [Danionella cerebrum]